MVAIVDRWSLVYFLQEALLATLRLQETENHKSEDMVGHLAILQQIQGLR